MTNLSAMVITIDKEEVENVPENLGIGAGVSFKSVCFDFFSTNIGSSVIGTQTFNSSDDITR